MKTHSDKQNHLLACVAVIAIFASAGFARAAKSAAPPGEPVVLQPVYRVQCGSDAYMTTTNAFSKLPVVGQTAYLAKKLLPGTTPLYRFKNPGRNTFRDAHALNAPWKQVEYLGNTWEQGGDQVLLKQYKNSSDHYVTLNANEPPPAGYEFVGDLGYGYERFGTDLTRLLSLQRGDVEVRFDRVAGGCVWHILHKQVQLVNNAFYGRQVCEALDLWTDYDSDAWTDSNHGRYCACDCGLTAKWNHWFTNPSVRMGSPCPTFARQGDDSVLIRTIPVESAVGMNQRLGGGPLNPVLYSGLAFEKRVTLGVLGRDGIIKFVVNCTARGGWAGIAKSRLNICGVHLCQFMDQLSLYDPATGIGIEDADWQKSSANRQFIKHYSGKQPLPKGGLRNFTCVVLHNGKDHAVGLMGAAPGQGPNGSGSVESFLGYHWKQLDKGKDNAEFANNTIMMTPMNELPLKNDGRPYVVYVLVGSIAEVKAYGRELYAKRANLDW